MNLGINAVRARSGGAVAHILGILENINPQNYGFREVHIWGYRQLLEALPERSWLKTHCPDCAGKNIFKQLFWERSRLLEILNSSNCEILFNVDAGSVCPFKPAVTASRDMLSYEVGEMQRYGISLARLRLLALKHIQNAALRHADGSIFLTMYASKIIQGSCGALPRVATIPHGVGEDFKQIRLKPFPGKDKTIQILYVSNIAPYKHQWHVVEAVAQLRAKGFDLKLQLVGGGEGLAKQKLEQSIAAHDPNNKFVRIVSFTDHAKMPHQLAEGDIFVFASSCENMPNTLLEAMAAGLPIACSDRGPMPEVLEDGGVYFNPEKPGSISAAITILLENSEIRTKVAERARQLAGKYSWKQCGEATFSFLAETVKASSE